MRHCDVIYWSALSLQFMTTICREKCKRQLSDLCLDCKYQSNPNQTVYQCTAGTKMFCDRDHPTRAKQLPVTTLIILSCHYFNKSETVCRSPLEGTKCLHRKEPTTPAQAQEALISNKQSEEWWEILIEIRTIIHKEETKANKKMPHSLAKADKQTHALTSSSLNNQQWNLQYKSQLFPKPSSIEAIILQSAW